MTLNELRDEMFTYAEKQGFHKAPFNFGESLMLIVSELAEALEADRAGKYYAKHFNRYHDSMPPETQCKEFYEKYIKGTVEEEIADAIMRICALAGHNKIDLDWHVKAKMTYNKTRPFKHGKKYG